MGLALFKPPVAAAVFLATLTASSAQDISVGWKPPLVPLSIEVAANGAATVKLDHSIQTPVGTFTVTSSQPLTAKDALVVLEKGKALVFRLADAVSAVRVFSDDGNASIRTDTSGNVIVSLDPPERSWSMVPDRLRRGAQSGRYRLETKEVVQLTNGAFQRLSADNPVIAELANGPWCVVDLNGDGVDDIVVTLYVNYGGSGVWRLIFPAVSTRDGVTIGEPFNAGDRVQIRAISPAKKGVVLDYVTQGDDDALCCPTLHVLRQFRYQLGRFEETPLR